MSVSKYIEKCIFMVKWDILLYKKYSNTSWLFHADKYIERAEQAIKYNTLPGIPISIRWDNIDKMDWIKSYM